MKYVFKIAALCALVLTFFACQPGCKSPCKVAEETYGYLVDNPEQFVACLYESEKMSEKDKAEIAGLIKEKGKDDFEGMTFHAVEEVISEDGTVATVKLESTDKNGKHDTEDVTLKKDDKGNWRVVLNK